MTSWDDGKHRKVKKVVITYGDVINSVQFDYDDNGRTLTSQQHGSVGYESRWFELDSNEYMTNVYGSYTTRPNGQEVITSLAFSVNRRLLGPFGTKSGNNFFLNSPAGNQIVGFMGSSSDVLHSIDVRFGPIAATGTGTGTAPGTAGGTEKVEAQGRKGGKKWDDGANHDGAKKVVVGVGRKGVHYVKFSYDKSGQLQDAPLRGSASGAASPSFTFEIDHPSEYIVSVVGYYYVENIQGLQFKTNKKESQVFGYADGTKFTLEVKGKNIVGFHGFADTFLNSLGAHFAPTSIIAPSPPSAANKLEAQGGTGETVFDDGAFDGVRKVYVGQGDSGVAYVKFEYDKGGNVEPRDHGTMTMLGTEEFELEQGEYITSVEGYYDKILDYQAEVIAALVFKTSKGRTSKQFGMAAGTKFELDGKGGKLVGFHGSVGGEVLHSLGAYLAPSPTPLTPAKK